MTHKALGVIAVAAFLVGCAHVPQWRNPASASAMQAADDQATLAAASCEGWAAGTSPAPAPMPYMPVPAPSTYTTYGTVNTDGLGNSTVMATTRAHQNDFATNFNSTLAMASAAAVIQHRNEVEARTAACMRSQGWIDINTPDGPKKWKAAHAKWEMDRQARTAFDHWATQFFQDEARRPDGINYFTDQTKKNAFLAHLRALAVAEPNAPDFRLLALRANNQTRADYGLPEEPVPASLPPLIPPSQSTAAHTAGSSE